MRTNRRDEIRAMRVSNGGEGFLQAGVFDLNVGRPVDGAAVEVYGQNEDGSLTAVEQLTCDASGQTAAVEVAAPPFEYSQSPDFPKPYSEYTIRVRADGFTPLWVEGIQVFDQETALQNAYLRPANDMDEERRIDILPHTLWGDFPPKEPEDEVKPLNPPTGFVVIDNPVVPETIVVHDGAPSNASAPNYYVPFKDYIKEKRATGRVLRQNGSVRTAGQASARLQTRSPFSLAYAAV